jgi:hypothetical protein
MYRVRGEKKTEKPRKPETNNRKNWTVKKNRLKFWKNRMVRFGFGFISLKPTKPIRTEPTGKNRAKPIWTGFCPKKPNRTETGRFEPVSFRFFFFLIRFSYFFYKNRTEPKMIENDQPYT